MAKSTPVVFISSTSDDLKPYRAAARDAAISAGLLPKMMEYFPATGRPSLAECLRIVSEADVVAAVVAHRYGWVPDDQPGGEAKSITWLECEQAAREGKRVLAFIVDEDCEWPVELRESYRASAAIEDGSFTPALAAEVQRNRAQLNAFKQWLSANLRATFRNPDDLRGKVSDALSEWRGPAAPPPAGDPHPYLEALRAQTAFIDIRGLQVGTGKAYRFPIEDLYIPLTTMAAPEERGERAMREPVRLEDALRHPRLVISGDPGAGKSTFLRHVAFQHCDKLLAGDDAPFPILISIADLVEHRRTCRHRHEGPSTDHAPTWLGHFLGARSDEFAWSLHAGFFERKLSSGAAVVLLDGLDEARSRTEREDVARLFENATQTYKKCRFVVTTRPLAYAGESVLAGFEVANIEPLETSAIDAFLQHWCRALFAESPQATAEHLAELTEALRARAEIRRMARNPVMLTALAVVHWNERRLPEQRADLYDSILTWLARSREQRSERPAAERCLVLLQQLALGMQNAKEGRQVQVSKGRASGILAPHLRDVAEAERLARAQEFLEQEEIDSGIIVSRASEVSFRHLTFQEHLAAKAIAGMADATQHELMLQDSLIYKTEWREVALLLGGILYKIGLDKVDALISAVLEALGARPELAQQARCAGLLGAMIRDLQPFKYQPADPRYESNMDAVLAIFDQARAQSIDLRLRMEAALALGQAGDPRLTCNNWITIQAGEFHMGAQNCSPGQPNFDRDAYRDEIPVRTVRLASYQIGRYPVTVEEYRRFLDAGGYHNEQWWREGGFGMNGEPRQWDLQVLNPNRPVVGVTWYEASAYCLWSGGRLPLEAEWERAARGTTARTYPWGDWPPDITRANYADNVGAVTPVGLYPAGATPEGIHDLAGNVWEWVADTYQHVGERLAPYMRVLRGGSFLDFRDNLRAAARYRNIPTLRLGNFGFRCVRDVAS